MAKTKTTSINGHEIPEVTVPLHQGEKKARLSIVKLLSEMYNHAV